MKILHLHLSRDFAGSETYAADLARLQANAGHTVAVLVRETPHLARWRQAAAPAAVLVLPRWAQGPLTGWVARNYVRGFAPDILHSHLGRAHLLAQRLARKPRIPHIGTIHLRYKTAEHAPLDALIAIAAWQLAEVPEPVKPRCHVVGNWLTAPIPSIAPMPPCPPFVFGTVGRLHKQKGMDILIQAFRQAFPQAEPQTCPQTCPNTPDVRLEIVGDGAQREELARLAADDPRIALCGYSANPTALYPRWHAYVSAARHEPFGLTLLEAMAHRLPLVCTRTEGPAGYLPGCGAADALFWAERNDVASLAAALQACHARKPAPAVWNLTAFDPDRALGQIIDIYQQHLEPRS